MKVVAIIQARMGSTRLPGKVMKEVMGVPMIELLIKRLEQSSLIDQIVLATSEKPENNRLVQHVAGLGYEAFQGSEDDVLERYYLAAKKANADIIIRITGDCPLVDPKLVDKLIETFKNQQVDYISNVLPPTFPDGLDVEVFTYKSLEKATNECANASEREHVTQYIQESGLFNLTNYAHHEDLSQGRWTVDEPEDFDLIDQIFQHFSPRIDFSWQEVFELSKTSPEIFSINAHLMRNEGQDIGNGPKLWKRAKKVIPGGNMLLSKRAEMLLPERWPTYFSRSKGCKVWDLDDNELTDMYIMGVGTNTLGYAHDEVDEVVASVVSNGNMTSLNCPEEIYLAEKLIELHPWADMARFARTGGEANAIAVRIARAASGKDKIAICGYHGWHDWYLAANINNDDNLTDHLLPGLEPAGVPKDLHNTVYPFLYNQFDALEEIVKTQDIGVIKMEVTRNQEPEDNFLQKVRKLATDNNIVLIFDECTSGFRQTYGGLHKHYDVEPDMAIFGKALGNGYAITATIGRQEIMQAAQSSFISSTFWTERIGPTAALKTLEIMERESSWEYITNKGKYITDQWLHMAKKYDLDIETYGLSALTGFSINSHNASAYKTLITQEMLKKGYLAGNCVYVSMAHTDSIINEYLQHLDETFSLIKDCEDGRDVHNLLEVPICHDGFKRLN